jgi:hypothetical protein
MRLGESAALWAESETEYVELRRRTPRLRSQTEENTRINGLLGRGLTDILVRVAPRWEQFSRERITDFARELERDFPQSSALPYVEAEIEPFNEEFERLIALMNREPRRGREYLATVVGGGIFSSPRHTGTLYQEHRAGRGEHPFLITDQVWMNLLSEDKELFRRAYLAHRDFFVQRPEVDRILNQLEDRWRDQDPRLRAAFDQLRPITPFRSDRDSVRWRTRHAFDLSAVSPRRQVIDGAFFAMPMPVGDYGLRLNRHLRRTVQIITLLLESTLADELAEIQSGAPSLIQRETARGRAARPRSPVEARETEPLLRMLVEGINTIGQALNFLLIDQIDGDRPAPELIRDLLAPPAGRLNSTMVSFTAGLRMSFLGPSTLNGERFRHPVEWRDGHLRLTDALTTELRTYAATMLRDYDHYNWRRALPCPVAIPGACGQAKTGLQYAADLFLKVSELLEY